MKDEPKKVPMTIRVPRELYDRFHRKTADYAQTHNAVVVKLLEQYASNECVCGVHFTTPGGVTSSDGR